MNRRLLLGLAVAATLAGCLGGGPGDVLGDDEVRTEWPLSGDGCDAVSATVPVDKFQVERVLPQGFTPVDSSGTFGSDQESGRTNLTLLTLACDEGSIVDEDLGIPALAAPLVRVEPVDAMAGEVDAAFYGFTAHAEDPALRGTLQEMGHQENRSKVFTNVTSSPLGSGGESTVNGDDARYRIRVGSGNPADRPTTFRVYHAGDRGLLVLDAEWTGADPVDGGAQLEVNEGSIMARFMDENQEPAYGVVRAGAGLDAAWHLVGGEGAR